MKVPTLFRCAFLSVLFCGTNAWSQATVRTTTPGNHFVAEGRRGTFTDAGTGRHFRGDAFETLTLRGNLQLPYAPPARLKKLVVHFRTSHNGPSLRSIELRSGLNVDAHIDNHLEGDYITREVSAPKELANVIDFGTIPSRVYAQTVLRLQVIFPGGIDSRINPGEFDLTSVEAEFLPK